MTDTESLRAMDALAARIELLLKDNHALDRSLDAERDETARLSAAVARCEGENAALREALDAVRAVGDGLAALADRVDDLADRVGRSPGPPGHAAAAPRGGRDEAAEQLHAILTSRSWRMTRPIRGLGRVVRRFRG